MFKLSGVYFHGHKISEYGIENGCLDYGTLAKTFDAVLNNDIISNTSNVGFCWDIVSGSELDEDENFIDIYQYFIVSDQGAEILQELNEIVYYNEALNMYVWGVTHYGTAWDYVLTNVKCNCSD